MFIAGRQLPALPPVLDAAAIQQVIHQIGHGSIEDRIFAAHRYASLLEAEESKYRALVGDPHASPNLRSHYTIGRLLNAIKDEEDIYDTVVDSWISARSATIEQNVAGLRLLLACLDCWLFQYPLTEESLVEKLGLWAVGGLKDGPVLGDAPPATLEQLLKEARRTYAMGLLSIALANEEYADEAVQTPLVAAACSYLQRSVMQNSTAGTSTGQTATTGSQQQAASHQLQQQQQQHYQANSSQDLPHLLVAAAQQQPEGFADEVTQLRLKMLLAVIRCLTSTGEYVEALAPFLTHQGVECCCILLRAWQHNGVLLNEVLQNVCSLLAHRRFGELLVEQGGVQLLLAVPRDPHTNMGLSLALFGLASLPLAFERTCALPAPIPQELVTAGLGLLAASSDAARKNAALFFDSAVHYPVMLEAFDAADGLHRLLYPLRHVVQLLQTGDPSQLRAEKQVAYHVSRALLQYIRAHLVLHISAMQRRLRDSQGAVVAAPQPHKPINTSAAVVEELTAALSTDAKLAEAFVRTRWPLLDRLAEQRLVALILELVRVMPGEERYFSDICLYCLEVLQLISLSPLPRRDIIASSSNSSSSTTGPRGGGHQLRSGMAVLLHAASTGNATPFYGLADPEIIATALQVISNCVTAAPSLAYLLPAPGTAATAATVAGTDKPLEAHQTPVAADLAASADHTAPPALELGPSAVRSQQGWQSLGEALEAGYAAARQAVRSSNGIRVLLTLLQSRQHLAPAAADKIRALACSTMLGLARDPSIRHILAKLQVGKLLAELVREPAAPGGGGVSSSRREGNAGTEGAATGVTAGERLSSVVCD